MSMSMATQLATRGAPLASRGWPSSVAASCSSCPPSSPQLCRRRPSRRFGCSSPQVDAAAPAPPPPPEKGGEYRPSFADDLLLAFFRSKMVEEVGWDSEKPGYAGLMEVATRLMVKGKSASEMEQAAVRVLQSLFPPLLLVLYKALVSPIANGQLAAMMIERQHFHANGSLAHAQLIQSLCLMENLGQVGCSLRNASIWKSANALAFASAHANYQLRLSSKITWVLICTWSQILKTIAASSTSGCRLHLLMLTKPSRNHAWTSAQTQGGAVSSEEIVTQIRSVAPKFDLLLVKDIIDFL